MLGTSANIPTAVTLNNGTVTYTQTTAATLNIAVSGTGTFIKAGGGLLTIGARRDLFGHHQN